MRLMPSSCHVGNSAINQFSFELGNNYRGEPATENIIKKYLLVTGFVLSKTSCVHDNFLSLGPMRTKVL